jgi:O-acetyl-ADP-ribose deacetylase (regulator of RNase III)
LTILLKTDNLFDSGAEALVNAVNCVGVMGGGIALAFKNRFPEIMSEYNRHCERKYLRPGTIIAHPLEDNAAGTKWVISYPTKIDWRDPSRLSYIIKGFHGLLLRVERLEIQSVAIPALGCGLGGLKWSEVEPILYALDEGLPEVTWMIYPPQ